MSNLCLGIIAVTLAAVAAQNVEIIVAQREINIGEDFSIRCNVKDLATGDFLRFLKYFHDSPEPITISTLTVLENAFKDNNRFKMNFTMDPVTQEVGFQLTIKDARPEDAGKYSCAIVGGNGISMQKNETIVVANAEDFSLKVTVFRKSNGDVQVYQTSTEGETHSFLLEDSEDFDIEVETSGTNPAPSFYAKVGSREITPQFTVETRPEIFSGDAGLKGVKFLLLATAKVRVDHSFSRGFTIGAVGPGNVKLEEALNFEFTGYPPTMEKMCTNLILAADHDKDVLFNCTFLASETPDVYITYLRDLASGAVEKVDLFPGEYNTHYEVEVSENGSEEYVALMKMEIIYPQMFRNYSLVVSTSKGEFTHDFVIERDYSKELDAAGSSQLIVSLATLLLSVILSLTNYRS